jgi:DNA-binding protein HU-beta
LLPQCIVQSAFVLEQCLTGAHAGPVGPLALAWQDKRRLRPGVRPRTFEGMNKSGLVAEVAKRTDSNRADVAAVIDETMAVIRDTVAKGERVALVGFGTFEKRRRNRRIARNPRQPDVAITVPARDIPQFSPGQAFKQAVAVKRRRTATAKSSRTTATRARASAKSTAASSRTAASAARKGR